MKNSSVLFIVAAIIFLAGGFFGGMKYQQSKVPSQFSGRFDGQMRNGQTGQNGNRQGFRPINGTILSADTNSITVKLQDGSSAIVIINSKTTINKAATASASDLIVGERVSAFGTTNADGSTIATSIQLNPILRGPSENLGK